MTSDFDLKGEQVNKIVSLTKQLQQRWPDDPFRCANYLLVEIKDMLKGSPICTCAEGLSLRHCQYHQELLDIKSENANLRRQVSIYEKALESILTHDDRYDRPSKMKIARAALEEGRK